MGINPDIAYQAILHHCARCNDLSARSNVPIVGGGTLELYPTQLKDYKDGFTAITEKMLEDGFANSEYVCLMNNRCKSCKGNGNNGNTN